MFGVTWGVWNERNRRLFEATVMPKYELLTPLCERCVVGYLSLKNSRIFLLPSFGLIGHLP